MSKSNSSCSMLRLLINVAVVCAVFDCCQRTALLPSDLQLSKASAQDAAPSQLIRPFPQNRVQQFYFHQAETQLDADAIPPLLPQFPGLDGGAFGHWGQNPEEVNFDHTLNQVDTGNVVSHVIHHFGRSTTKGIAVRADASARTTVLFDPQRMTFVDSWQGGFVKWGVSRFGVMGGVQADGPQLIDFSAGQWQLPQQVSLDYKGFHRSGATVIFEYALGSARVLDSISCHSGVTVRTLHLTGEVPGNVRLVLLAGFETPMASDTQRSFQVPVGNQSVVDISATLLPEGCRLQAAGNDIVLELESSQSTRQVQLTFQRRSPDQPVVSPAAASTVDLTAMLQGNVGQWVGQTVITKGRLGDDDRAFAIDTFTIPFEQQNPFGAPMRLVGVGALSDGRMVVSTLMGDVWVVTPLDDQLQQIRWQRFAAGLYQPLGLVVHDDQVIALGRDQVTRLHDHNGDGEADFYECVTNAYPTTDGHDFCTSLQMDQNENLYWFTAAKNFGVTRLADPFGQKPRQRPESLATGLRNSNGIGVSPDGDVVLATVQEGTWTPASAIFEAGSHSYHGLHGPKEGYGKYGYDLPLCFLPRGVDNSSGELIFLPDDARLGPLAGQVIGTSFGDCSHYLLLREVVNGKAQGGIMPLEGDFQSGVCRLTFNQHDGCLYVAGTEGWQSYAAENGCLQRIRYTGRPAALPSAIETHSNGILMRCNRVLDPESVRVANVFCQQWNYLYSSAYGSPEYSVSEPGRQAHDYVPVRSVHLLSDQRSVFIEIPQLHPVMQFHLHLRLKDADGAAFIPDLYTSIFELGSPFTDFPGYQLSAKQRAPDFPMPEKLTLDPRLAQQDQLGTNFGWVQQAIKLSISALPGLQYAPTRLRVAPGQNVALTFHNTDSSMPHNIAIVPAAEADVFADKAMLLASNPRAIATHYVPQDSGEICFSPILNPEDQYTVFFEAPAITGEYRILCTYPGHARVMRASLYVLPEDQPLPEASETESRRFVKQWTLDDLADAADQLHNRSFERGKSVFAQAGCIKCHRMGNEGSTLGPDLTRIHERFRGSVLLRHVLEPSLEINKQFQSWLAVTNEGLAITGLMMEQSDDSVTLLPNPLKPDTRITLARRDLEELTPSTLSTMPAGLLMVFERDEILDLLAYLQSAGESQNSVFGP